VEKAELALRIYIDDKPVVLSIDVTSIDFLTFAKILVALKRIQGIKYDIVLRIYENGKPSEYVLYSSRW